MTGRISPTALILTAFAVGVSTLLLSESGEPDRGAVLRLGLRDVVSSIEATGAVSGDLALDLVHAVSEVVDAAPATDPTWVAAAATLAAYGQDEAAATWLGHVREPSDASRLLGRLVSPAGAGGDSANSATEAAVDAATDVPAPGGEITRATTALQDDLQTVLDLADVPRLARQRLTVRVLRAAGDTERADAAQVAVDRDRDRMLVRIGGVAGVLLLSGAVGLGLWVFARRIRERLARRFDGLPGAPPFVFRGAAIYTALVGWFSFHLAISILLPFVLLPTGLLDQEPALPIALATAASGLFGLAIIQRLIGAAPLLSTLGVHVHGFRGGTPHAAVWGWLFYCMSLPAWMSAAFVNNALVSDETVLTNPVIPLLAEASSPSGFALLILSVGVLAPFFEEAFFRGFLYRALRDRLGVVAAVALSSLAFALVHLSFQTVLPLFALGCVMALAYEWTGSLVPSIMLHSVNNVVSVALVLATMS
ncbi:MAG: hypothetical protein AMXMBFR64_13190 [Myxococcales bacterium]